VKHLRGITRHGSVQPADASTTSGVQGGGVRADMGLPGEGSQARRPVRVFISYAHESDAHAEAVRGLWVLLRALMHGWIGWRRSGGRTGRCG
jgi:hypothetical protein